MLSPILVDANYAHPPALVWKVLTTPRALAAWLMETTFARAEVGHRFRFTDRPRPFWDGICECTVESADEPRQLALAWGTNTSVPTRVTWTLAPTLDGGTRVTFRHDGLAGIQGFLMKQGMTRGWKRMLQRSIPFVLEAMARDRVPTRDEVKAALRRS